MRIRAKLVCCLLLTAPLSCDYGASADESLGAPGFSGGGGGTDPSAGENGGDGTNGCAEDAPDTCITSCHTLANEPEKMACEDGVWSCPDRKIPLSSCAANTCAAQGTLICCHSTGVRSTPDCGEDAPPACPPTASLKRTTSCFPADERISACGELHGRSCHSEELRCYSGDRCGTDCSCVRAEGGALVWECWTRLC